MESSERQVRSTRWVAAGLLAVGILSGWPAAQAMIATLQAELPQPLPRWTLVQLVASCIQLAVACYLFQVPDRSAVRVAACWGIVFSATYAGMIGWLSVVSDSDSLVQWLDLTASHETARAWSFVLLCLNGGWTLTAGRLAQDGATGGEGR